MNIDVSIVIVNYNVKDLLLTCISSFEKFHKGKLSYEIIVIDNASSDGSIAVIKAKFPEVILIANTTNKGFPAANNQGFAIAKGKYILMLNPDTELKDDSLLKLFNYCESQSAPIIAAPQLLNTNGTFQQSVWRYPSLFSVFCEDHYLKFLLGSKNYSDKSFDVPFEAESFSGAAILFPKSLLSTIGNLDETMFWIEDIDFCYRSNKAGIKLVYYPQAKIIHHSGQSAKTNYTISISNQIFNKIKFFRKHYSVLNHVAIICLSLYIVTLKFVLFTLLAPFNIVYSRKAMAYAYTWPRVFNPPKGIQ